MSRLGSLAPLGGGGSLAPLGGSGGSSDNRGSGGGLGALTQLGSARLGRGLPAAASEDLDSGLDALLSGGGAAAPAPSLSKKSSVSQRRYGDSDSGSDGGESTRKYKKKKKDKKAGKDKKKDKDRDRDHDRDRDRERDRDSGDRDYNNHSNTRGSGGSLSTTAAEAKRKSATSSSTSFRPTTAPLGDGFDDDALFGLGTKQPAAAAAAPASSASQRGALGSRGSRRSPSYEANSGGAAGGGGDWDDASEQQQHHQQEDLSIDPDDIERSAPSTARTGGRLGSGNAASRAPPPPAVTQLAEDYFATQKLQDEPPPVTFGSRRMRGVAAASSPSSAAATSPSATVPAAAAAPSPAAVPAPAPSAVFMPGGDDDADASGGGPLDSSMASASSAAAAAKPSPPTLSLKELMAKKRAEARRIQEEADIVAAAEREAEEEMAAMMQAQAAKTAAKASAPVASAAAFQRSPFDDLPDPSLDDNADGGGPVSSGMSPSHHADADAPFDSPSAGAAAAADPFGSMLDSANPMDDIDEKQGNLFSGFGSHRPASSTNSAAAPLRQRRNLSSTAATASSVPPAAAAAASVARAGSAHPGFAAASPTPTPPTTARSGAGTGAGGASSAAPPPKPKPPAASTAASAAGPKGPVSVSKPTVDDWITWLGLSRTSPKDIPLLSVAEAAASAKVPANWSVQNGFWVNSKKAKGTGAPPGTKHERHPLLKFFMAKLDNKRLAIQYNIADDDDDLDESLVASGDEEQSTQNGEGGHSPSSINRSISMLDESLNPLSPVAAGGKKKDLSAGFAAATAANNAAVANSRPSTSVSSFTPAASVSGTPPPNLGVNTTPAYGAMGSGGGVSSTPSPFAIGGTTTPSASPPSTGAGSGANMPSGSPEPSRAPSFARLASVPEGRGSAAGGSADNSSIGSMDDLMTAQRAKTARLAEQERLSHERIAAAAMQGAYDTAAIDGVRVAELMTQVRLQAVTIEELEKRKRTLAFELESADAHLAAVLGEQRQRFQTQAVEAERRAHAEQESLRAALSRSEASHQAHTRELEDRIASLEARRSAEVAQAISQTESHARELAEHTLKIHAQQMEASKQHYERELESARLLHANEVSSLQSQASSSVFLRSLVTQVESSAANLDSLSKKVYQERAASERLTFEQLQVRDRLLNEKETALDAERKHCDDLLATFKKLQREHEEDKVRLREEHARLTTLQHDVQSENALLKDQLLHERDQLRKERAIVQQQRDAWEIKFKRENADLELKKELVERAHVQSLQSLEDAQHERADVLKQIDVEREEMREEKRSLAQRRAAVEAGEAALQHDESEFQKQVDFFDKRMADLTLLGAKVQASSAAVAEQYARLDAERSLIEAARAEAQQHIDSVQKAAQSAAVKGDQLRVEKTKHVRAKTLLLQEQQRFMQDKENALQQIVSGISGGRNHLQLTSPTLELMSPLGKSAGTAGAGGVASWPGGAGLTSPHRLAPAGGDLSAALASLSSHASELRGFMADEKIMES